MLALALKTPPPPAGAPRPPPRPPKPPPPPPVTTMRAFNPPASDIPIAGREVVVLFLGNDLGLELRGGPVEVALRLNELDLSQVHVLGGELLVGYSLAFLRLERKVVELDQHLTLCDMILLLDVEHRDLAQRLGAEHDLIAADSRVVGGLRASRGEEEVSPDGRGEEHDYYRDPSPAGLLGIWGLNIRCVRHTFPP